MKLALILSAVMVALGAAVLASRQPDVRQIDAHTYAIARRAVEAALADEPALAAQARSVEAYSDGVFEGFRLYSVQKPSLLAELGFQSGEIVQFVGGRQVHTAEVLAMLLREVREAGTAEVIVSRRGIEVRRKYRAE